MMYFQTYLALLIVHIVVFVVVTVLLATAHATNLLNSSNGNG